MKNSLMTERNQCNYGKWDDTMITSPWTNHSWRRMQISVPVHWKHSSWLADLTGQMSSVLFWHPCPRNWIDRLTQQSLGCHVQDGKQCHLPKGQNVKHRLHLLRVQNMNHICIQWCIIASFTTLKGKATKMFVHNRFA